MPILLLTVLLSGMGFGLVLPSFPFLAVNLGASSTVATTILGMFALGQFIGTPIWGRLSDRYGRKPVLVLSLAGQAISYLILVFADNLWLLALARGMNGLMSGNLSVAMAYVADITPVERRAQGMGYVGGAISLGFIVGPALGGLLGGTDAATASLVLPASVATATCVITALGALTLLRESLPADSLAAHAAGGQREGGLAAARRVFRMPIMARLVAVGFCMYFAMALFETIFPLWAGARFAWGPQQVGLLFTYLGLLVGLTQAVLVGRLVPRFGEARVVMAGLTSYAIGLTIMTQAPVWQVMMAGITFTSSGGALVITTMSSLVSRQASDRDRGLVLGVYQSGSWMGRSVGPPMSGLLFEGVGVNSPLAVAALLMLPSLAIIAALKARLARADAASPAAGG